ncbi:MAG: hypothetical protein FWH41_05115 [Treponema sp.]|nr:hypothetical protein [Treponema sp.]
MENFFTVKSRNNPKISVKVAAGHFATSSAHRSHYIDIFDLKSSATAAREAARELAIPYRGNIVVDLIVCMDGTEILGAYLANELLQSGLGVINEGSEIHIITPTLRADGRFIFHQNVQEKIMNKNVVLMVASMSTGVTANNVMECLSYYCCKLVGISAVFTVAPSVSGQIIHSLFSNNDIPDFNFYNPSNCPMCKEGRKLDAVFNSEGITKL